MGCENVLDDTRYSNDNFYKCQENCSKLPQCLGVSKLLLDKKSQWCRYHIVDKSSIKGTSLDGFEYKEDRGNLPYCKEIKGGNTWGNRLTGSECYIKKDKDSIINDKKTGIEKIEEKAIGDLLLDEYSENGKKKKGNCGFCGNMIFKDSYNLPDEIYKCKYDCAKAPKCLGVSYTVDKGNKYCRFLMVDKTDEGKGEGNLKDSKYDVWASTYPYCSKIEGGRGSKESRCFIKNTKDNLISAARDDFFKDKEDIFSKYKIDKEEFDKEENQSFCQECDNYVEIKDPEFKDKKDIIDCLKLCRNNNKCLGVSQILQYG